MADGPNRLGADTREKLRAIVVELDRLTQPSCWLPPRQRRREVKALMEQAVQIIGDRAGGWLERGEAERAEYCFSLANKMSRIIRDGGL